MPLVKLGPSANLRKLNSGGGDSFSVPSRWTQAAYGAGWPVNPLANAPEDVEIPRTIDYPMSVNATLTPRTGYGLMPFAQLLAAYEGVTEVKIPVNLIHRELSAYHPHLVDINGNEIDDHPYQWMCEHPDRRTPFNVWMTRFFQSAKVYDAPAVYLEQAGDGSTRGLHYIDGSTLFLIVDEYGNVPAPEPIDAYYARVSSGIPAGASRPLVEGGVTPVTSVAGFLDAYGKRLRSGLDVPTKVPAYTQIIKGTPFSWWSSDQIWYQPTIRRLNAPYGTSFIEQAWPWIMIIVNITAFELAHYRTGNMPEGFVTLPESWTGNSPDTIQALELAFNSRMEAGSATERMRLRMFPDGAKWTETKKPDFPAELYKQAWNNILHTIGIPPGEFGDIPSKGLGGKGFKDGNESDLSRSTIDPARAFLATPFNDILKRDGVDDAWFEMAPPLTETDPSALREMVFEGMAHGTYSLNDALGQLNLPPVGNVKDPDNIANKHLIIAGQAIFVVEDMSVVGGEAQPMLGGKSGGEPLSPEAPDGQPVEHTPDDMKTLMSIVRRIEAGESLSGKTLSLPSKSVVSTPLPTRADKMTQAEAGYVAKASNPNERCALCCHFQAPGGCAIVEGSISPEGWCEYWEPNEGGQTPTGPTSPTGSLGKVDATHADGAMVAVMIPAAVAKQLRAITEAIGLPDSAELETPDNMHVTLAFFPDSDAAKEREADILKSLETIAASTPPLDGKVQGFGVFNGNNGTKVLFALLDEPELPFLRTYVCAELDHQGIEYGKDYGFVPHITMAYFPEDFELPAGFEVPDIPASIGAVTLAFGPTYQDVTLKGHRESVASLSKSLGLTDDDDAYFGAPISREIPLIFPTASANGLEIVAMVPEGLPARAALWKPEGEERIELQEWIGGPQYVREEAAYLIDRALGFGLVPLAYVAESCGENGAAVMYTPLMGEALPPHLYGLPWIEKAAVLDFVLGQYDRHAFHNYGTHPDDPARPVLFDNGLCLPAEDTGFLCSPFVECQGALPLSLETMAALTTCLYDASTWFDVQQLVGMAAVVAAKRRVQRMIETGCVMVPELTDGSAGL